MSAKRKEKERETICNRENVQFSKYTYTAISNIISGAETKKSHGIVELQLSITRQAKAKIESCSLTFSAAAAEDRNNHARDIFLPAAAAAAAQRRAKAASLAPGERERDKRKKVLLAVRSARKARKEQDAGPIGQPIAPQRREKKRDSVGGIATRARECINIRDQILLGAADYHTAARNLLHLYIIRKRI